MTAHISPIAEQMAYILAPSDVALADQTACVVHLINNRFSAFDVHNNLQSAIDRARLKRGHLRTAGFAGMLFASGRRA